MTILIKKITKIARKLKGQGQSYLNLIASRIRHNTYLTYLLTYTEIYQFLFSSFFSVFARKGSHTDVTATKSIPPWLSPQHSRQGCHADWTSIPIPIAYPQKTLCEFSQNPHSNKTREPCDFSFNVYVFLFFTPHTYAYTVSVCVAFPYSTVISDADSRPPLVARFIGFRGEHWSLAAGAFSSGGGGELGRPRSISSGSTDARSNMNLRSS